MTELEPNTSANSPAFTSRVKRTIEMSRREAQELRHSYIGTEHLLLGVVRQGQGVAVQILNDLGVEVSQVRAQVLELMSILNVREVGEPPAQVQFDDTLFRGLVRALGQQLRPDLEAAALDDQADQIADNLLTQLRQRWVDPGNSV
jgi:ATP-dependent Clp protease ATP-binding subunit ClpC